MFANPSLFATFGFVFIARTNLTKAACPRLPAQNEDAVSRSSAAHRNLLNAVQLPPFGQGKLTIHDGLELARSDVRNEQCEMGAVDIGHEIDRFNWPILRQTRQNVYFQQTDFLGRSAHRKIENPCDSLVNGEVLASDPGDEIIFAHPVSRRILLRFAYRRLAPLFVNLPDEVGVFLSGQFGQGRNQVVDGRHIISLWQSRAADERTITIDAIAMMGKRRGVSWRRLAREVHENRGRGARRFWYNGRMKSENFSTPTAAQIDPSLFDVGHQGDVDRTQIAARLAMTPTERLRHHESWRSFVKEALKRAEFRRKIVAALVDSRCEFIIVAPPKGGRA